MTWCLNSSFVAYSYRRTRVSRSYQQRPECLPKDQSIKKLSTKGQSAYRRTRASRSYQQKARVPTEGPERQEVTNQGHSAYRSPQASRSYQHRPECLPKDRSVKKASTTTRAPKPSGQSPEQQKQTTRWKPHTDRSFLCDGSTYER